MGCVVMGEFLTEIRLRVTETYTSLQAAQAAGDDFLADAHASELENLHSIAVRNGVDPHCL
ncbi:hypothetical protein CLV63_13927 [Murinocardiopsis flavida]|uniref:Uncharacterized protein n=2 Tax=Murinocardiopsis flavida TaxID=645275 RepID=A0A2P8CGV4_9ACTN|nr:hypothetical protein CLV63_13927 [Murinocardiopsis flavida]